MAQMYPPTLAANAQYGEKLVYAELEKLPADWVVFHDVWEHYRAPGGQYINYEADFIVLIPAYGYVAIEVKDWPEARIRDGVWESKNRLLNGRWFSMGHKVSPLHQADVACNRLKRGLVSAGVLPPQEAERPEHRCIAILTNCVPQDFDAYAEEDSALRRRCGNLPLDSLYVCGREALQQGLQARLESLFTKRGKLGQHMSPEMVRAITAYLAPSLYFRMDLHNYIGLMEDAATPLQELLPLLEESTGGIHVEGCAGSGKTVLAVREAARQAAALPRDGQHRLLILCYNYNLAHALRRRPELRAQADVLLVSNFHDYCEQHLLRPAGQGSLMDYSGAGDRLSAAAVAYLLAHAPEAPHYDTIFVDEAQDFRTEWWELIQQWLTPQGKLYAFADSHQRLYDNRGPIPALPTRIRLRRNLRNPREIARYSADYLPQERRTEALNLSGAPIDIRPAAETPQKRAEAVRACIARIQERSDFPVRNCDIVVLSPWAARNERSCFPYLADILDYAQAPESGEEIEQRHLRCAHPDSPKILGDTIKSFKGLEAPFIILTDICAENESRGFNRDAFYVACTRAKFGLCIIPTPGGESLVRAHAPIPRQETP